MRVGPRSTEQFSRFGRVWEQGEHVVVSGGTGSGKTSLGRHILEQRIKRGGFVMMFVCKLDEDATVATDYAGWTRWEKMKKNPSPHENRVLLWPKTEKEKTMRGKRGIQREVFSDAFDMLSDRGKWTVDIDEGLYMCHQTFMNLADEVAMLHALGRSSKLTIITKMQRPSNVPLIVYGSASHAFIGRTREAQDLKRVAEMGGKASSKELQPRISGQGRFDFLWLPVAPDWEPESVNLRQ